MATPSTSNAPITDVTQRQARQLLAADRAQRDQTQRQQRIEAIQTDIAATATVEETKELTRLRNAVKRHDTYRRQRDLKIEEIHQLLLPDGSRRPLRLRLTRREQISVRINDIA